ncbi:hypothetical protein HDU98_003162, partial [Podochytrium sp. JEL0797]
MNPHRTSIKTRSDSPSAWRTTLKSNCLLRIQAARQAHLAQTRSRCDAAMSSDSSPYPTGTLPFERRQGTASDPHHSDIQHLLREELAALALNHNAPEDLDPDTAVALEREMLEELREYEALHRTQSNSYDLLMMAEDYARAEDERLARDVAMHLEDVKDTRTVQERHMCPACRAGVLVAGSGGFACLQCGLRVESRPETKIEKAIREVKEERAEEEASSDLAKKTASEASSAPSPTPQSAPSPTPASPTPPAPKQVEAVPAEPKKSLVQRIKDEAHHLYVGMKLLGAETRISSRLLKKLMQGNSLSRREDMQLKRTVADLLRLVPMLIILLIPFLELALPLLLYIFPNMLPSTFESKFQAEEKKKKLLKVRLEMAKFLQETVSEVAVTGTARAAKAKEFSDFFQKYRNTGTLAPTNEILAIAKKFQDDLTLNSLSRPQLVSMARYMSLNAFGTDTYLRHQINDKLVSLKIDDAAIAKEGVDTLTIPELQQACQQRGIKTMGASPARLKSELTQWLDLHLTHGVPGGLLILSRAFTISERIPLSTEEALKESAGALQATLSSLPQQVVNETQLHMAQVSGTATSSQKLNVIKEQEELIEDELYQDE